MAGDPMDDLVVHRCADRRREGVSARTTRNVADAGEVVEKGRHRSPRPDLVIGERIEFAQCHARGDGSPDGGERFGHDQSGQTHLFDLDVGLELDHAG